VDLSKVYDFKCHIFVHPNFWKDTFGFNYMSKDALFDVGVHITNKYLHSLPSTLAIAITSF
jgi:hypothetical protein